MRKLLLLLLACSVWACSDGKNKDASDSGAHEKPDASEWDPDAGEWPDEVKDAAGNDAASTRLERAPGSLERPPGEKLPDDLKPPKP